MLLRRSVADEFVSPLEKPLHVGSVGVAAVVLAPCELSIEKALVHGRHLRGMVVAFDLETPGAEQSKYAAGSDGCHEAALLVEPFGVTFLGDAVADEREARGAEGDEFVRI